MDLHTHDRDRDEAETERDRAETERDRAEGTHEWAEAQRQLENIPKYVEERVSKELRAVEQKMKQHGWHGKAPIPPMAPAPHAPPGDNQHPQALTETTAQDSEVVQSWDIKRAQGPSRDEAIQKGLAEAQKKLIEFLRGQSPSIAWVPTPEYIREQLVKHIEDKPFDTGIGMNPAVDMRVEVRANQVAEMRKIDHRVRVNGRLESMGRLLAIVVAALAAVSGYIRVDLWSNRSYTNLLRLGLTAVLALVSLGIWHLPL